MSSFQRRAADIFTALTGLHLVPKGYAWELLEPEVLATFLREFQIDCVFDIGANAGQYGARLRKIGFTGTIISFEPNPLTFAVLETLARRDGNWVARQAALDEVEGEAEFNVMNANQFSSLHEPDNSHTETFRQMNAIDRKIRVTTHSLDNVFDELQQQFGFRRPFLKMDTQGHDVSVVKGGVASIRKFAGLQSELSFVSIYRGSRTFVEALAYYQDLGFKLTALVPNNAGHFPDLNEIDCIMYNPEFA
jgi:FkbM family methyltransferase